MKTTIDEFGRLFIPEELRQRARLKHGTVVRIELDDLGIRLTRVVTGPTLSRKGGCLLARPTAPAKELPEIDVAALIEKERHLTGLDLVKSDRV